MEKTHRKIAREQATICIYQNLLVGTSLDEMRTYISENEKLSTSEDSLKFALWLVETTLQNKESYQKLLENPETNTLSQAALETLAIIAYNEPITRMQIDKLRGVGSSQMIRKLVAKGLVKESGRSDLPGRPILYETTNDFLDYFGLSNIKELPDMEKYIEASEAEIEEEKDLYTSKYKEEKDNENR